jgi:hypothetical protein
MHENAQEPIPDPPQQLGLDAIAAPQDSSHSPDKSTQLETVSSEIDRLEIENDGLKQNISERKKYAHRAFCLVISWLVTIGIILILQGFHLKGFDLTSGVLQILIGSTTTGVVGIFLIVTRYLFHYDEPPK